MRGLVLATLLLAIHNGQGSPEFKFDNGIRRTSKQREPSGAHMYFDSETGQFKRVPANLNKDKEDLEIVNRVRMRQYTDDLTKAQSRGRAKVLKRKKTVLRVPNRDEKEGDEKTRLEPKSLTYETTDSWRSNINNNNKQQDNFEAVTPQTNWAQLPDILVGARDNDGGDFNRNGGGEEGLDADHVSLASLKSLGIESSLEDLLPPGYKGLQAALPREYSGLEPVLPLNGYDGFIGGMPSDYDDVNYNDIEQIAQFRGYEDEMTGYTSYDDPSDVFIPSNYMNKIADKSNKLYKQDLLNYDFTIGNSREKKRQEMMDTRNHRILPTPYPNPGQPSIPYPVQGPTPPPSHDSTQYHNSAAVQTQFPAGPTPFPHVQTSASTIAYSAYQPYNKQPKQPSMFNSANIDDISKDKAYNYDYIIGRGVDKIVKKGTPNNNALPFMNNIAEESTWMTTPASVVYPPQQPQQENKYDHKQYEPSFTHDYQDYQDNYDYGSYGYGDNYDNYGGPPQVPSKDHQMFKKQDNVAELSRPTSGFQPMYPYDTSDYSKQDMYGYNQSPATPSTTTTQQTTWQDNAAPAADYWSAPRTERGSSSNTERSRVNPSSYSPAVKQPSYTEKSVAIPQEPRWQDLQKQQPEYPRRRNQEVKTNSVENERQQGFFSDNKEDEDKKFPHFPAHSGNGLDSYDIPKLDAIPAASTQTPTPATEDLKSERRSLPDTFSDYSNNDYVTSKAVDKYNTNNYGASRRSQSSSYDSFFDNTATNFGGYGRDTHTEKARSSSYSAAQNNYQAPYTKDLVKESILPSQNNYAGSYQKENGNDLKGFTSPPADFTSFPVGGMAENPFFDEAMDMFSDWGQKITDKGSAQKSQPQSQQPLQRQPQSIYTTQRAIVTTTNAPAVYEKFEQKFVDKRRVVPGQYNVYNPLNYGPTPRPAAVTTTTPKPAPTAAYSYFSQSTPSFNHNERSYHVYNKDFIDQSKNDFYSATKRPYNPVTSTQATTTTTTERPSPYKPNNNSPLGGYAMPEAPKNFFGTPEPQRNYFGTPTPGSYQNNADNLVGFGTSPQPNLSYRAPITTPQPSYYKPQEDQNRGIKRNIDYAKTPKPEYFGGSPTPSSVVGGQYFGGSPTPNYLTGTSKPLNNYAQTSPKPSIDYIPASPTPYNNYYAGGSPTPRSDYYSGGSPTPRSKYYSGGSPTPKNDYMAKSDNYFAGTPTPKKALFASPTPKSYFSGSTTPSTSYFGGSPTPKNDYYGGSPSPKSNYYSGGSPTPRTYNTDNDWSRNKFLGSKQVSSQVTVAPGSYPSDNPYVVSSRRDKPSNNFFSDSSNFQGFNTEDIGFGAGFPSFFSSSNRQAPEEDMYARSGVDDSQVAIRKPYQPALTFLSQEQFDDNDGMYENKFKHRSSDAVLPDPVDIPKLEGKSIATTSTEQLPPLVSTARTTIKSFVDHHKDLHSTHMDKSTESSERMKPKQRVRVPPSRMKPRDKDDKSSIRMRLTKSKSKPSPSRHHQKENKPSPRNKQISKNSRFPNFKEIEQNVKQTSKELMRSKPFLAQPQRRRDNPAAAPPSGSTRPRFSARKSPQQQPRGLKPGGQQQSRGILGQGGLLSKLFSRRSRKLDMESAESESETEILKLSASEVSESNSNAENVLPFLDEQ